MPAIHQHRPPARVLDPQGPLLLCAPRVQHAPATIEAIEISRPELRAFMPFAHLEQTVDTQYTRLAKVAADYWTGRDYIWHLFDPAAPDTLLGCVGLHRRTMNQHGLELGYWVRSDRAGRGLCTRAARMAVVIAFERFDCRRVQCGYDIANLGSARVAAKVGFAVEADLPNYGPAGTAQMRADGWRCREINRMTALDPAHARAQAWYAPLVARMQWWDWMDRPA